MEKWKQATVEGWYFDMRRIGGEWHFAILNTKNAMIEIEKRLQQWKLDEKKMKMFLGHEKYLKHLKETEKDSRHKFLTKPTFKKKKMWKEKKKKHQVPGTVFSKLKKMDH